MGLTFSAHSLTVVGLLLLLLKLDSHSTIRTTAFTSSYYNVLGEKRREEMRWSNRIARTSSLIENRGCSSEQSSSPPKPRTASSYISTVIVASSFSPISYSHSDQYERDDCEQSGESENWRKIIFCYLIHRWVECSIKLISFHRVNTLRFREQEKTT